MKTTSEKSNKFIESLDKVTRLILLQWKTIMLQPSLVFLIFAFPIIFACGIGVMIATGSMFAATFSLTLTLVIGIIFGNVKFLLEESTFMENSRLTVINKFERLISLIVTCFFFSFLSFSFELIIVVLGETFGFIFMSGFVFNGSTSQTAQDMIWSNVPFDAIYMYYLSTFILLTSTFFFASTFFRSNRTFSIFVLIWFIISLVFSGAISTIWNYYNPETNEFIATNKLVNGWFDLDNANDAIDYSKHSYEFINWFSWTPLLVPQWFTNQHYFFIFRVGAQYIGDVNVSETGITNLLPESTSFFYWSQTDRLWNFSLIAPYLYSIIYLMLGVILSKEK